MKTPSPDKELAEIIRNTVSRIIWPDAIQMLSAEPELLKRADKETAYLSALIDTKVKEARIDELGMALYMAGKVIIDGVVVDGKFFENNGGNIDGNILKARLAQLKKEDK
jgi:hypothetical protein